MKAKACLLVFVLVLLLVSLPSGEAAQAQQEEQRYFNETGHWVSGEFLKAYDKAKNPQLVYGYPITEAYQDPASGKTIQYFQRVRFELDLQAVPELRVTLTPIGRYMYVPSDEIALPEHFPACRQFSETGKQVCYAFLDFFNANGGVAQFGYPISNFEIHDGRIVQYFQRARFEWHPDRQVGQRVILSNLGSEYFKMLGESPALLMPVLNDGVPQTILKLQVRAFTESPVTSTQGKQTVYVTVQDQNRRPVTNAQVIMVVTLPGSPPARYIMPATNEHGISLLTFSFAAYRHGIATISATAVYENLAQQTVTSFRVWY